MLIACSECGYMLSEHAYFCPKCGCPNNSTPMPQKPVRRAKSKRRRLPNGFGSIKHLSGKRRNPYAAYPATKEFKPNGTPVSQKAIGYFETYNEAYAALTDFNRAGLTIEQKRTTFEEVYQKFMSEYTLTNPSKSALTAYTSAFKKCESLYSTEFATLRKSDFQAIFDANSSMSKSTTANLKKLFNQMYKIAIENNVVDRNYASNVIQGGKDIQKGVPFTSDDIAKIWEYKSDETAQIALIMIYSGYRVGELSVIDVKEDRFVGGLKTASGKKREVPIHPAIKPFVGALETELKYYKTAYYNFLGDLNIANAITGEKHTPHDCRHTFSWLADKYKMDNVAKHLIMGHALSGDTELSTYTHRTFAELEEEIRKIKVPKTAL